jgi:hypothetical protein
VFGAKEFGCRRPNGIVLYLSERSAIGLYVRVDVVRQGHRGAQERSFNLVG